MCFTHQSVSYAISQYVLYALSIVLMHSANVLCTQLVEYYINRFNNSDVEDTFSSTHSPDYIPASPDYFPASPGNTSSNFLDDLTKDLLASLALSPFHDDTYMKVVQAYDAIDNELPIPPQALIAPPTILPPSPVLSLSPMFDFLTFLSSREAFTT
ncbi:hypothetical protein Tco_1018103 [Tanacetum coccineum]|uniref:Uncharacterized protein n=1 Tax=Tanacetum coccineum TaxID=301880 RepID=A0ABQ5FUU7_9ASTR